MKVVPEPRALPGHCFVCLDNQHTPFVDLEFSTEFEDNFPFPDGAVYVCSQCVKLMAEVIGLASHFDNTDLEIKIVGLESQVFDLTVRNTALENSLGNLLAAPTPAKPSSGSSPGTALLNRKDAKTAS